MFPYTGRAKGDEVWAWKHMFMLNFCDRQKVIWKTKASMERDVTNTD
jgi:hypothetical protein